MRESQVRFIRQQGFHATIPTTEHYHALMLQPRLIAAILVVGTLIQSPLLFFALSAVLWWSALIPTRNPFDAIYNHLIADRSGPRPLGIAPAPRRFAQGVAATLALIVAAALLADATFTAWIALGVFDTAVALLVFGRFCAGSYAYYLLTFRYGAKSCQIC